MRASTNGKITWCWIQRHETKSYSLVQGRTMRAVEISYSGVICIYLFRPYVSTYLSSIFRFHWLILYYNFHIDLIYLCSRIFWSNRLFKTYSNTCLNPTNIDIKRQHSNNLLLWKRKTNCNMLSKVNNRISNNVKLKLNKLKRIFLKWFGQ